MLGLGPTWTQTGQAGGQSSVWGAEAVVDFFFWRSKRFGWYLEASYAITLSNGNKKSMALTDWMFFSVR